MTSRFHVFVNDLHSHIDSEAMRGNSLEAPCELCRLGIYGNYKHVDYDVTVSRRCKIADFKGQDFP